MNFAELCCSVNKLKAKQNYLEKSGYDLMQYIKTHFGVDFEEEFDKYRTIREDEFKILRQELNQILQDLKNIKLEVSDNNIKNIDIFSVKISLLSLQNLFQVLKHRIQDELEELLDSEMQLTIEVTNIEMKLMDINKPEVEMKRTSKFSSKCNDNLSEEVKEFDKYLIETGGHSGTWTHDDHLIFLKYFNKFKNEKKVITALQTLFSDMSEEQLLEHYNWYKTYLNLKSKQKIALEKWRNDKINKNKTTNEQISNDIEKVTHKVKKIPEDQTMLKEKLAKWKLEKQQKMEQNLPKQQQKIDTHKQTIQQEKKREVEKWKSLKIAKERTDKVEKEIILLKEKGRKMRLANKLIREFQNQDNIYISKRLERFKINVCPPSTKRNTFNSSRNPDRIFQATKQWISRISEDQTEQSFDSFSRNLSLKRIPKLAIPEWRQVIKQI